MRHRAGSGKSLKKFPLISAAPLGIHIEIKSAAPLNVALIRIVTIFY